MNVCRQCGTAPARYVHVSIAKGNRSRALDLMLCRECCRVLEAMLDAGLVAEQLEFEDIRRERPRKPIWVW